jgi:hypothetical protein
LLLSRHHVQDAILRCETLNDLKGAWLGFGHEDALEFIDHFDGGPSHHETIASQDWGRHEEAGL